MKCAECDLEHENPSGCVLALRTENLDLGMELGHAKQQLVEYEEASAGLEEEIESLKAKLAEAQDAFAIVSKALRGIYEAMKTHYCGAPDSCAAHRLIREVQTMNPAEIEGKILAALDFEKAGIAKFVEAQLAKRKGKK